RPLLRAGVPAPLGDPLHPALVTADLITHNKAAHPIFRFPCYSLPKPWLRPGRPIRIISTSSIRSPSWGPDCQQVCSPTRGACTRAYAARVSPAGAETWRDGGARLG